MATPVPKISFFTIMLIVVGIAWLSSKSDGPKDAGGKLDKAPRPLPTPEETVRTSLSAKVTWRTGGFGSVMLADVTVRNDSDYDVKDPRIACQIYADSGTRLGRTRQTIYQVVPARAAMAFPNLNLGLIHSQSAKASCSIDDFVVLARRHGAETPTKAGGLIVELNLEQILELQRGLAAKGFDPGPQDGKWGARTDAALRAWRRSLGLSEDVPVDGVVVRTVAGP